MQNMMTPWEEHFFRAVEAVDTKNQLYDREVAFLIYITVTIDSS